MIAEWAEENATLHHNREIYEVLTDDKDYFKVLADARLKLQTDTALALPCIEREDSRGETVRFRYYKIMRESEARTYGPLLRKDMWEAFTMAWYISQFLFQKL